MIILRAILPLLVFRNVFLAAKSKSIRQFDNVLFHKVNTVSTTRSQWLFTFLVDLEPYINFVQNIKMRLGQNDKDLQDMMTQYPILKRPVYQDAFNNLRTELNHLKSNFDVLDRTINNFQLLNKKYPDTTKRTAKQTRPKQTTKQTTKQTRPRKRPKRAIIPLVGKALSFLFGTVSSSDLNTLKKGIKQLATSQTDILHMVQDNMSILNITRVEINANRHVINDIVKATNKLQDAFSNVTHQLREEITHTNHFVYLYLGMDLAITETRDAIQKAFFYLDNLKQQLNQMSLGHVSPSIIMPDILRSVLFEIQRKLPKELILPKEPSDLWHYYKTLSCAVYERNRSFLVIVSVPLLDIRFNFDVFKIFNIPIAYNRTVMTARYDLQYNFMAVNLERTKYMLLTDQDAADCCRPSTTFCSPTSAIYSISNSPSCLSALFTKDKPLVTDKCNKLIRIKDTLPKGVYITQKTWVISTSQFFRLQLVCSDGNDRSINVVSPISIVEVKEGCIATSNQLTLTSFFREQSQLKLRDPYRALISTYNVTKVHDVWALDHTSDIADLHVKLPIELKDVTDVPMRQFMDAVSKIKIPITQETLGWISIVQITMGIVVGLVIMVGYYYYCCSDAKKYCFAIRRRCCPDHSLVPDVDLLPDAEEAEPIDDHERPTSIQLTRKNNKKEDFELLHSPSMPSIVTAIKKTDVKSTLSLPNQTA